MSVDKVDAPPRAVVPARSDLPGTTERQADAPFDRSVFVKAFGVTTGAVFLLAAMEGASIVSRSPLPGRPGFTAKYALFSGLMFSLPSMLVTAPLSGIVALKVSD